jgi:hypothetical protein
VVARTGAAPVPVRDERQGVHPAVPDRGPDRVPAGSQQPDLVRPGQAADRACRVDAGPPEHLVGQQVADARDPLLVHEPRLHRRAAPGGEGRPELGRRHQLGVRSQPFDGGTEPDPAQPPRVDQQQAPAVSEGQGETGPAVVTRLTAALPVVAAVGLGSVGVGDHYLA